jgi:hypothetical protein
MKARHKTEKQTVAVWPTLMPNSMDAEITEATRSSSATLRTSFSADVASLDQPVRAGSVLQARFRVRWIDTRTADPDQYFTSLRLGDRHLPQAHDIWLTVAIKNYCALT